MLFIAKKKILYKDWIYEWLLNQKHYIKESTYANYSSIIFNHLIPSLGDYTLEMINNKIIQDYLLSMYENGRIDNTGGLSDKTIKDIAMLIKTSFKNAIKNDLINYINLDFSYPKCSVKSKMYVLTKHEQNKLISFCLQNKTSRNLGILLALYSGLRIGELCALKWQDFDLKKNIITINKTLQRVYIKGLSKNESKIIISTPKTRNANRVIPINKDFSILLKEIKTKDDDYILSCTSNYIEPRTYRKYFDKVLKTNKIDHINFHSLRHTFATNCIRLGVDYKTVSELLGHSSVNIALNLYVHPLMSQKKKCIDLICKDFNKNEL